jgi:hypothetical protein
VFRWGIIVSWLNSRLFICVQGIHKVWPYRLTVYTFPLLAPPLYPSSSTCCTAPKQILVCRFAHKHTKVELIGTFSTFSYFRRNHAGVNLKITRTRVTETSRGFLNIVNHYVGPTFCFYQICQLVQKTETLWQKLNYAPSLSRHKHHDFRHSCESLFGE